MIIGNSQVSRNIDKYCMNTLGIPGIVLMENAAIKVLNNMDIKNNNSFVIVCGRGNNGGDGFAVGRHLIVMGKQVEIFLIDTDNDLSNDAHINYNILKKMGVDINIINSMDDIAELRESLQKSDIIIDAIFGTGLKRNIEGIYESVISVINENSSYVLSIDVPSGMDSNNGRMLGTCVRANKTVSFVVYKKGFVNYGTDSFTGDIVIENIGVPNEVIEKFYEYEYILDKNMIKNYIGKRDKYAHKGDYGKTLILAGSKGYTGAAYISTQAAIKSGAGLVTLCTDANVQNILSSKLIEAMTINFHDNDRLELLIQKSNSIAIGPGMGKNDYTLNRLKKIIEGCNCPIIIDADGINVLQDNTKLLRNIKSTAIITPHLGEMSRITNLSIEYIKENRIKVAKEFAKKHKVIVVLKGYNTIITDGLKTIINPTGNSAMASGGMGDCLTGIIASFVSQGYNPMIATSMGVFIHGYCGEKLSNDMFSVDASSVLENLSKCIKELSK